MTTVLDSWAIIRLLDGTEPAAGRVGALLDAERPVMSWINLGEVFYVIRRAAGEEAAAGTVRDLRDAVSAEVPGESRVIDAARIKALHPMTFADAFAAATALAHDAMLWTGDPELLVTDAPWRWHNLRADPLQ